MIQFAGTTTRHKNCTSFSSFLTFADRARFAICIRYEYQWKNNKIFWYQKMKRRKDQREKNDSRRRRRKKQRRKTFCRHENIQMHISVSEHTYRLVFRPSFFLNSCEKKIWSKCCYMLGKMPLMIIQASHGVSENLESVKAHREWCDKSLMNCDGSEWKEIQYYPSDVSMCDAHRTHNWTIARMQTNS